MLTIEHGLPILKNILGKKVNQFSSNRLQFFDNELSFIERQMNISMHGASHVQFKSSFFMNEDGDIFHDYTIKSGIIEKHEDQLSDFSIEPLVINKIEIYGREFPLQDFKSNTELYKKYSDVDRVDNVFVFFTDNVECFTLVFDDFVPSIKIYFGNNSKDRFFYGSQQKYSRHDVVS